MARSLAALMPLLPRWRFMTEEAKALTKRTALSAGVVLVLVAWWIWKAVRQ
jgi:hypothetical protein